jgi:hypothetical protein
MDYDLVRREVLHNILIAFGVPLKLVRFSYPNGQNQGYIYHHCFSTLPLNTLGKPSGTEIK